MVKKYYSVFLRHAASSLLIKQTPRLLRQEEKEEDDLKYMEVAIKLESSDSEHATSPMDSLPTVMPVLTEVAIKSDSSDTDDVLPEADLPKESEGACVVCLEDLCDRVAITELGLTKRLPCGHRWHQKCLSEWLSHSRRCPLCNYGVANTNRAL